MELSLDTNTRLGVVRSRRTFMIDDMAWDKLMVSYSGASRAKAAAIERQLTRQYHRQFVKSGQIVMAREASAGGGCACGCSTSAACPCSPCSSGLSATVTWYADKSALKARIQATDSNFANCKEQDIRRGAACVQVYTASPGSNGSYAAITVIPLGSNGKAMVYGSKEATAIWKKTEAGYDIDFRIPWNRIVAFRQSMKLLPVQVTIDSRAPDGTSKRATTGDPEEPGARGFVVLKVR